jgi:hypothetical protein
MPFLFGHFSRPDAVVTFPGAAFLAAALLSLLAVVVMLATTRAETARPERADEGAAAAAERA